jgi:periplasmic protein CpxP/Spy
MIFTMTKMKLLSMAVIGLLLINIGILAFLFLSKPMHSPIDGPRGKGEGPKLIIIEKLHFDKEQVTQYEKLIDLHQKTVRELDGQIRETKNQLYATLAAENDKNTDSLQNKLGEIQRQIESAHYNHFEEIKKLCKPGQTEYFKNLTGELAKFFAPGKKSSPPPRD